MSARGLIVAAPATGSGKTMVTAGLLRALRNRGVAAAPAKVGPDYIDPAFLAAAAGRGCANLDSWAMRPETLAARIGAISDCELAICEGVMGLFDGAPVPPGQLCGSTAELAKTIKWPVVLVIDAARQSGSAAALLRGFATHDPGVRMAGAIFNRVAGEAHRAMIEQACVAALPGLPILGWLPRDPALALPERHLGLVQARETAELEARLDAIAALVSAHVDLDALTALAAPIGMGKIEASPPIPPFGQRIAVARDDAFAFAYPEVLAGWRTAGAEISVFSPLADEAPAAEADAVYLPGGYPELHAARLAANARFLGGLRARAQAGAAVYGECGGAMVLGESLEDGGGVAHAMAGLLPLTTSFRSPKLHLGYRDCALALDTPLGRTGAHFRAHEFHYASEMRVAGPRLFHVNDARGRALPPMGQAQGRVMGSFLHLIDVG